MLDQRYKLTVLSKWKGLKEAWGAIVYLRFLRQKMLFNSYGILTLFPSDYEIERDTLFQLWIVRGFRREHWENLIKQMIQEGYIEETDKSIGTAKYRINVGKVPALSNSSFTSKDHYTLIENEEDTKVDGSASWKHVSVATKSIDKTMFETLERLSDLRTLLLVRDYGSSLKEIPPTFFNACCSMEVLGLSGCHISELPSTIIYMTQLRFLDLSFTLIERIPESKQFLEKLQTLKLVGCKHLHKIPPIFFKACRSMQTLDLSGCHISELPSTIKYMTQLRFLGLSYTLIERIPESIQCLRELQTLKLVGCKHLHTLPRGMTELVNLCHLDFDVLGQLTCMPKELGSLVKLRTLSAYIVSKEDGCSVRELRTMNSLCGSLCISGLENANHQHACEAAMHEKDHLTRLHLRWSPSISYNMEDFGGAFLSLLRLKAPPSLTELQISNYPGLNFPEWIQGLKNLVSITLLKCRVNNLTRLQRLPNLRHLNIYDLNEVRNINSECEDIVSFPQLETLTIDGMHSLISWVGWYKDKRVTDFPMLSKVSMKDCPKLPGLPFLSHLPSLEYLEISYCEAFQSLPEGKLSASLKTLIIDSCPLLKKRCLKNEADWEKIPNMTKILIDTESVSAAVSDDESEYYEDEFKYVEDESE